MLSRQERSIPKVQPRPGVFDGFVAWLERQPADKTYDYQRVEECPIRQYSCDMGLDFFQCHTAMAANGGLVIIAPHPWTFGGALDRARQALVA